MFEYAINGFEADRLQFAILRSIIELCNRLEHGFCDRVAAACPRRLAPRRHRPEQKRLSRRKKQERTQEEQQRLALGSMHLRILKHNAMEAEIP